MLQCAWAYAIKTYLYKYIATVASYKEIRMHKYVTKHSCWLYITQVSASIFLRKNYFILKGHGYQSNNKTKPRNFSYLNCVLVVLGVMQSNYVQY